MPTMRAVQYDHYGPPEVLHATALDIPAPKKGQVLVRVDASSVNAADIEIRSGHLKLFTGSRFPRGSGFDFSGEIAGLGDGVAGYSVGDAVWGFRNGIRQGPTAAMAEYVVASIKEIALRPAGLDPIEAAALPGAAGAALAVLRKARFRPGERVLVRGGAGGVGSSAVQLAHALGGEVTTLVRDAHIDRVHDLGADHAFSYQTIGPADLGEFDVIIDAVGRQVRDFRRHLARGGRMVVMVPNELVAIATSTVHGSRRARFVQAPPDHDILKELAALADDKAITPVVDTIHGLADIADAHQTMERGGAFGKQVVRIA